MSNYSDFKENIKILGNVQLDSIEEINAIVEIVEKGKLLVGDGSIPSSLSATTGFDGNILTLDSNQDVGVKWSITNHLPDSGAIAGSYTLSDVTIDANGLITNVSNGSISIDDIKPTTTKGDLLVQSLTNLDRLVNSNINNQILTVDTLESLSMKWSSLNINDITPTFIKGDIIARNVSTLNRVPVGVNNSLLYVNDMSNYGLSYGNINTINLNPTLVKGDLMIRNNNDQIVRFANSGVNNHVLMVDSSNTEFGINWKTININDITPTNTTGDLLVHDNVGQLVRLPISVTNGDVLLVDNTTDTNLKWGVYPGSSTALYTTIKQGDFNGSPLSAIQYVSDTTVYGNEFVVLPTEMWLFKFPLSIYGIRVNFSTFSITTDPGIVSFQITDSSGNILPGSDTPYDTTGLTYVQDGKTTYMLDTPLTSDTEFGIAFIPSNTLGVFVSRLVYQIIYY